MEKKEDNEEYIPLPQSNSEAGGSPGWDFRYLSSCLLFLISSPSGETNTISFLLGVPLLLGVNWKDKQILTTNKTPTDLNQNTPKSLYSKYRLNFPIQPSRKNSLWNFKPHQISHEKGHISHQEGEKKPNSLIFHICSAQIITVGATFSELH